MTQGFKGVSGKMESKPAKHFRSALGQTVNFFYTLQGEAAGAQAFSNFDTLLAPFIRYDGLDYVGVKQALQEFIFNINVPTRVGFQTPFTNVTLDLTVPSSFANQSVIIGGKPQKETYKEFQKEMDVFNKAFLEVMLEGDAKGRIFTFPIPTYNITDDFDWDSASLDLLWKVTAKYGVPYFSNFINSDLNPEDARSMCCRLRLDTKELAKRGGGLFGALPLTGSIGVVTINLARIGYLSKNEGDFIERLENLMVLAKQSLEIKRKVLERFMEKNLYPYAKYYLRNIKKQLGAYWKNHFSTIGVIGMNEACLNLFGENTASQKGMDFTVRVLDFARDKLLEFQNETGNNYNLEATPAEGTAYRLARKDREKFPKIIFANSSDRHKKNFEPFYTNSTQLPVNFTDDVFKALDLQDNIQTKYTGGTVLHLFAGERIKNFRSVKNLVRKICENYRLPYFTITPTFSICSSHGYLSGENKSCPRCGDECEVYSRVVGYLRPVSQWNKGKQKEFRLRKSFRM
jgi:ribonucleoside-triphosphate reductase